MGKVVSKAKYRFPIFRTLVYFLIATLMVSGGAFARYTTAAGNTENGRVAKFGVSVEHPNLPSMTINNQYDIEILENGLHIAPLEYIFTVTNLGEVSIAVRLRLTAFDDVDIVPAHPVNNDMSDWVTVPIGGAECIYLYINDYQTIELEFDCWQVNT